MLCKALVQCLTQRKYKQEVVPCLSTLFISFYTQQSKDRVNTIVEMTMDPVQLG